MSTLTDIANWVTQDYLNRSDIATVSLNAAKQFYQVLCAKIPFDQLMITSSEVSCVAGTASYSLASLTPKLRAIASIRMTFSSSNRRRLKRSHVRVYDSLSLVSNGMCATYARWADSIELNPPPESSSYTFRVRYWSRPTIAAIPGDTILLIPEEWEELMRWETLYRVYHYLDQQDKAMALVMPSQMPRQSTPKKTQMHEVGIIPRLWNDLLTTVSQQENVDEDFSINPTIRAYSYR